jgi:centromere protein S
VALTQNFQKQRLKSALWYRIGKIVDEETLKLGVNATPQFIGSLTELTWAQIGKHSILLRC